MSSSEITEKILREEATYIELRDFDVAFAGNCYILSKTMLNKIRPIKDGYGYKILRHHYDGYKLFRSKVVLVGFDIYTKGVLF